MKTEKLIARLLMVGWVQGLLFREWPEYKGGHLYGKGGDMYMGRWDVVPRGSRRSKVLSFLTAGRYEHVRLHWINQADVDRELHDHPFAYRTFILAGWYDEQYIPPSLLTAQRLRTWQGSDRHMEQDSIDSMTRRRIMEAGRTVTAEEGQFHRIARVSLGGVWTLFCTGEDARKWGFLMDGRWIKSTKFFQLKRITRQGVAL